MWDVGVGVGGCGCEGVWVYFTVPRAGESSPPRSPTGLKTAPGSKGGRHCGCVWLSFVSRQDVM